MAGFETDLTQCALPPRRLGTVSGSRVGRGGGDIPLSSVRLDTASRVTLKASHGKLVGKTMLIFLAVSLHFFSLITSAH